MQDLVERINWGKRVLNGEGESVETFSLEPLAWFDQNLHFNVGGI